MFFSKPNNISESQERDSLAEARNALTNMELGDTSQIDEYARMFKSSIQNIIDSWSDKNDKEVQKLKDEFEVIRQNFIKKLRENDIYIENDREKIKTAFWIKETEI